MKEREGNITDSPDHKKLVRKGGEEKKMKKCIFAGDWTMEKVVGVQRYAGRIVTKNVD